MTGYSIIRYSLPLQESIIETLSTWINDVQNARKINIEAMIDASFLSRANRNQAHLLIIHNKGNWLGVATVLDLFENGHFEVGFAITTDEIASVFLDAVLTFCQGRNAKSISFVIDQNAVLETEQIVRKGARFTICEVQMKLDNIQIEPCNDQVELRVYTKSEHRLMREILMLSFGDSEEDAEAIIQLSLTDDTRTLYGIYYKGILVGTINLIRSAEAYVTAFAVHPKYQGKGIGRHALANAVQNLLDEGYPYVLLDVEVENEHALNLYKRVGFQTMHMFCFYQMD